MMLVSLVLIGGLVLVLINGASQVEEMNLGSQGNETRDAVIPFIVDSSVMFGRAFSYIVGGASILAVIIFISKK